MDLLQAICDEEMMLNKVNRPEAKARARGRGLSVRKKAEWWLTWLGSNSNIAHFKLTNLNPPEKLLTLIF